MSEGTFLDSSVVHSPVHWSKEIQVSEQDTRRREAGERSGSHR